MPAAKYRDRLTRLVYSSTDNTTIGGGIEAYTAGAKYWCSVEDLSGAEKIAYGATYHHALCKIKVHNFPELDPQDRLHDEAADETYTITGIYRGDNELIVMAIRGGPLS